MTDQTESEEPLTPAECVEYLDDIVANNAAGARNLAIPIELLSDSAAALRALEAKVRELEDGKEDYNSWSLRASEQRERAYQIAEELRADRDRLAVEVDRLSDVLLRNGFVRCDIPACNCGDFHHRFGLPERWQEIEDELARAGFPLSNSNGNLPLNALREMSAEIARLTTELAAREARQ